MARFYSTFSGSSLAGAGISADTSGNRFNYSAMTSGTTLKTNIVNARSALSAQFYADLTDAYENGNDKWVIPSNGYTRAAGNFAASNIYKNDFAQWQSDPKTRSFATTEPVGTITIANSNTQTAQSISFAESYYTDATAALDAALVAIANGGPAGRASNKPLQTLASLHHDHDMTYLAWDDFTPGTPQTLSLSTVTSDATGGSFDLASYPLLNLSIPMSWAHEYLADKDGSARITATVTNNSNGSETYTITNVATDAWNSETWVLQPGSHSLDAGTYTLTYTVQFADATFNTSYGAVSATYTNNNAFTLQRTF